jgi:predicted KAP-like P-loop ATPase
LRAGVLKSCFFEKRAFFNWQKSTLKVMQKILRLFREKQLLAFFKKFRKILSFRKKRVVVFLHHSNNLPKILKTRWY